MIIDHTDYSSKMNFDSFLSSIDANNEYGHGLYDSGESRIYGRYEYMGELECGYFCHLYQEWDTEKYVSGGYTGTITGDGNIVNLSEDVDTMTITHRIFRRDFSSLADEIMRYGDFCVHYCFAAANYLRGLVKDKRGAGAPISKKLLELKERVDLIDYDLLTKDCRFAIRTAKEIRPYLEEFNGGTFNCRLNGKDYRYPFLTNIMSEKEKEFVQKWGKKKVTSEYFDTRERLHFEYLEEMAKKTELNYYEEKHSKYWKNPLKSFLFVAACVWAGIVLFFTFLVFLAAAVEGQAPEFTDMIALISTFITCMLPSVIIGLIKIAKYIEYKKAMKAR